MDAASHPLPPAGKPKPGRRGYVLAAALLLAAVAWLAFTVRGAADEVIPDFERVVVPGEDGFEVEEPGTLTLFHERPSTVADQTYDGSLEGITITVYDPDGEPVDVLPEPLSKSYTLPGRSGTAIGRFEADQAGEWRLEGTGDGEETVVAVGEFDVGGTIATVLRVLVPTGVLVLGAIAAFVVTLVRRLMWKPVPGAPPA